MITSKPDLDRMLAILAAGGLASSVQLQQALGKSQPTVSRLLSELKSQVLALGAGRATRYGLAQPILHHAPQQPLWWVDESGALQPFGQLSLLAGDVLHVEGDGFESITRARLPWFLAPLRPQGFLGRLVAQRLNAAGLSSNPEAWSLAQTLFAAMTLPDSPGAIVLGNMATQPAPPVLPASSPENMLDALAASVASTGHAGSSAGGEQPKFLAQQANGDHVLVKFTPSRGTPFGERWHDLLHAECLASEVLARHGVAVAKTQVVESGQRTYLLCHRFDRLGAAGRRHVVAIGAVHEAFVPGPYQHWAATCAALVRQGRLPPMAGAQAQALLNFGELIGNGDMHSGNFSLVVERGALAKGPFTLAPVYDMLPMRWRPDTVMGAAPEYTALTLNATASAHGARAPALMFWAELAGLKAVSVPMRKMATQMVAILGRAQGVA